MRGTTGAGDGTMQEGARQEPVAGVVFDLDGTLYDKRPLERYMVRRLWTALPRLYRYTKVRTGLAGEDHGSFAAIEAAALARLSPRPGGRARWRRWIRDVYDPAVIAGMHRAVVPYPGVRELLAALRRADVRLGLVSDYVGVDARLAALGIEPRAFDFVLVTEEEQGAMKPAPRVVARTVGGMGLPGARMLMVGDREHADRRFADAAGMAFVGVLPPGKRAPGADPCWSSWRDAVDRVRARAGLDR